MVADLLQTDDNRLLRPQRPPPEPSFLQVYRENVEFVWRSVKRLGVRDAAIDDVVQEVFLVVHRRLPEFEGRSKITTWLFGITYHVATRHMRDHRRERSESPLSLAIPDANAADPTDRLAQGEALAALHRFLQGLDEAKRAAFILVQLEQMTVPEAAEALGENVNTVYARVRAARQQFEQMVARYKARTASRKKLGEQSERRRGSFSAAHTRRGQSDACRV